jgi:hypothetical protein
VVKAALCQFFRKFTSRSTSVYPRLKCASMLPVLQTSVLDPISVQPSSAPTLRRPQPAFDPHPASSIPRRRTSPPENRRVMKMRPLHILAAAPPGTRAVFRDCRALETPTFRGCELLRCLSAVLLGRHRPRLGAKLSVSPDITALRSNSANRHHGPAPHSGAEEVLQT